MDLSGNPAKIMEIADAERSYKNHMEGILDQVQAVVIKTLTEWDGAGKINFSDAYQVFEDHRKDVDEAFEELIQKTEGASELWSVTSASVNARFT